MNYYYSIKYRSNRYHSTILTSIAIVSEDGRRLAIQKVTPKRTQRAIIKFTNDGTERMFYSYQSDFQYVALCNLFGGENQLPENYPPHFRDLKFLELYIGEKNNFGIQESSDYPIPGEDMSLLDDALWMQTLHKFLIDFDLKTYKNGKETQPKRD